MKAFTLVETLISLAILGLITGVSLVSFSNYSKSQSLAATASAVAEGLRDARARTIASVAASQYGLKIDADRFTLFKGSTFASSTAGNETFMFPPTIAASTAVNVITFARVTGNASVSGTIDVYIRSAPGTKKAIIIQTTGLVGIQ